MMIKKMVKVADIQTHFDAEFLAHKEDLVAKGVKRYVERGGFAHPIPIDRDYNLLDGWINYCVAVELGLKRVECEVGTPEEYHEVKLSRNPKPLPSNLSKEQRRKRMVYVNSKGRCSICGKRLTLDDVTIDHIIPRGKQGTDCLENLQASCYECNLMKANMMPKDFYRKSIHVATYRAQSDEAVAAELYKATLDLFFNQMKRKMLSLVL